MINGKLNYFVIGSVLTFFVVGGIMTYAKIGKDEAEKYDVPEKESPEIVSPTPIKNDVLESRNAIEGDEDKDDERVSEDDDDEVEYRGTPTSTSVVTPAPKVDSAPSTIVVTPNTFTLTAIATHNSKTSCYTSISGTVYDLTPFINDHPGGDAMLVLCGKEGTALFNAQHEGNPKTIRSLSPLKIGTLIPN